MACMESEESGQPSHSLIKLHSFQHSVIYDIYPYKYPGAFEFLVL